MTLKLQDIAICRGDLPLLKALSATVEANEACVLKGGNGCGKTTLLQTMAGFYAPASGEISWKGLDIFSNIQTFRQHIMYLGHENGLKAALKVKDHLRLWARLYDTPTLLPAIVHYFALDDVLEMPCGQLSAGWQRRVAFSRLMLSQRSIWLLDEPLVHLDEENTERALSVIASHCDSGGVVMMAHHGGEKLPFGVELSLEEYRC